jgi:hypothetical protein
MIKTDATTACPSTMQIATLVYASGLIFHPVGSNQYELTSDTTTFTTTISVQQLHEVISLVRFMKSFQKGALPHA